MRLRTKKRGQIHRAPHVSDQSIQRHRQYHRIGHLFVNHTFQSAIAFSLASHASEDTCMCYPIHQATFKPKSRGAVIRTVLRRGWHCRCFFNSLSTRTWSKSSRYLTTLSQSVMAKPVLAAAALPSGLLSFSG